MGQSCSSAATHYSWGMIFNDLLDACSPAMGLPGWNATIPPHFINAEPISVDLGPGTSQDRRYVCEARDGGLAVTFLGGAHAASSASTSANCNRHATSYNFSARCCSSGEFLRRYAPYTAAETSPVLIFHTGSCPLLCTLAATCTQRNPAWQSFCH